MHKISYIVILLVVLASCAKTNQPILLADRAVVFIPDASLFYCPVVAIPDPTTLTDAQVAELLIRYDAANTTCRESLSSIKEQLLSAKQSLETSS